MAIHFVILLFMILIVIGLFTLAHFTDLKILVPIGFLFLAFSGLFITINDGVIIDQRVSTIDSDTLEFSYEDVILTLEDPVVYTYSLIAFYLGLGLSIFSGLAWWLNPMYKQDPFNY